MKCSDLTTTTGDAMALQSERCTATPMEVRKDGVRFPRMYSSTIGEARATMATLINETAILLGRKMGAEQSYQMATVLCDELRRETTGLDLKSLAWVEIARAFKRAVLYGGEVYALSVKFLFDALIDYANDELLVLQEQIRNERNTQRMRANEEVTRNVTDCYARLMLKAEQERAEQEKELEEYRKQQRGKQ